MNTESILRFIVIIGCCINSFYMGKSTPALDNKDVSLLRAAMIFTVISDFLLIWTGLFSLGILSFCIVQAIYSYRYMGIDRLGIRIAVPVALFAAMGVFTGFNVLFCYAAMYAGLVFFSTAGAFTAYRKYPYPNNLLIVMGMVLFLLCDIAVFLYYTVFYYDPVMNVKIFNAIWLFYLPAQALLSSSARVPAKRFDDESMIK